ncbi:hypothetical protein [Methanofollis fontis]|uniref:L-2-amino-thiazoline-4-carboxylic acid hydrolase n=1 Tax=Methanofollis fontis TaxID=2052832 RepID=A0A483CS49_9EURY|nr:hypothetical protein [Methanofollis fontis]TAJ45668.1 hypothetical protein CUJ86_02835 [Methanofollis fontis]
MVGIEEIPAELRWTLATRLATAMPFAFDKAMRERIGEDFGGMVADIWLEAGKKQIGLAKGFNMPLKNAADVANAYSTISTLLLGPELQGEVRVARNRDCAEIAVTSCPMCTRAQEMGVDPRSNCGPCRAYAAGAVGALNPAYAVSHRSGMCVGDERCEIRIEPGQ